MADAYTVVVTREPEWDEHSRGRALRLGEFEAGLCGCGCGLPVEIARDPKQLFTVDEFTCHAGRALDQVRAEHEKAAREAGDKAPARHGKHLYVRVYDPARDPAPPKVRQRPSGGQDAGQDRPGPPAR